MSFNEKFKNLETKHTSVFLVANQSSKIERMEGLLREANENIRDLQSEVQVKSTALSHEKNENQASQAVIEKLKSEFDTKLAEREESLKKMFMRKMG